MTNIEKALIGALGGLSAVCVKFLGQDFQTIVNHASNLTPDQITGYIVGYSLLTPILMFLGAFVAWSSDENKKTKLIALAISAPAMITTYAGGDKSITEMNAGLSFSFISSAYASDETMGTGYERSIEKENEKGLLDKTIDAIGIFFGYDKAPKRYWVIVGSFRDKDEAGDYINKIHQENPSIRAWIGDKIPPNEFYPVIVGQYSLYSDAIRLKDEALKLDAIDDAYLSSGIRRQINRPDRQDRPDKPERPDNPHR